MGKRIIQQRRGRGTTTYKVKKSAFKHKSQIPRRLGDEMNVLKLLSSGGHSTPLAKVQSGTEIFYIPAFKNMYEGETIKLGKEIKNGNIMKLNEIPVKTKIYCIESRPFDGGKFIKSGGSFAVLNKVVGESIFVMMPSKKEKKFNGTCRAIIGVCAGEGKFEKPLLKAGKQFYIKKSKNKLWPRTSAIKMNAIDHPFGSGRGKNPKSKIAKRNAPPGAKVGLIRPKRTGKKR